MIDVHERRVTRRPHQVLLEDIQGGPSIAPTRTPLPPIILVTIVVFVEEVVQGLATTHPTSSSQHFTLSSDVP